jgi:hypothetical protein
VQGDGINGNMWTTFDKHKQRVKGAGYARYDRCFVVSQDARLIAAKIYRKDTIPFSAGRQIISDSWLLAAARR